MTRFKFLQLNDFIATNLKTTSVNSWKKIFHPRSRMASEANRLKLEETTGVSQWSFIGKFLLAAVVLGIPLYQKFPLLVVPGSYVRIRLEDFLALFILAYLIVSNIKYTRYLLNKVTVAILIFWTVGFLSVISAVMISKTVNPNIALLHWARRVEYMIFLFFALTLMRSKPKETLQFLFKLLVIAAFLVFVYGVGQKYLNWPVIITQNEQYSKGVALRYIPGAHLASTFAGHYDLASYLVLILPIFITAIFVVKGKWSKFVFITVSICSIWLLGQTLSRISVASYFFGVIFSLIVTKRFKEIFIVITVSVIMLSFSTNLFDRYFRIIEVVKRSAGQIMRSFPKEVYAQSSIANPPSSKPVFEDRSTSIRLNVEWPRAIRAFQKSPVLGTGYSSITLATDNDYLRLLGEIGILGAISFLTIFFFYLKKTVKNMPFYTKFEGLQLSFMAGITGGFLGTLINAVFIDVFEASKFAIIFWLLTGVSLYIMSYPNAKKNLKRS